MPAFEVTIFNAYSPSGILSIARTQWFSSAPAATSAIKLKIWSLNQRWTAKTRPLDKV
jgi:hypothetical protein